MKELLARILVAIGLVGATGSVTATQPTGVLDRRHEFVACTAAPDVGEPRALPGTVSRVDLTDRSVHEIGDATVMEYGARASHRGDQVAFCAISVGGQAGVGIRPQVVVCDLAGGNRRTLYTAPTPAMLMQPEWSPDDRYLAVTQLAEAQAGDAPPPAGQAVGDVMVVQVDTGTASRVVHGMRPRWSWDGELLAYVAWFPARETGGAEVTELMVARWDTRQGAVYAERAVVTSRRGAKLGADDPFTWISGTHLLALAQRPTGLYLVDASRGAPRPALAQVSVTDFASSPDGSWLAVASTERVDRRTVSVIHRVEVESTRSSRVATLPGLVDGMQFLGDGTKLVVSCFSPGPLGFPSGPRIWTVDLPSGATEQPFPDRSIAIDDGSTTAVLFAILAGQSAPEPSDDTQTGQARPQ